jgi:hypothetical protein
MIMYSPRPVQASKYESKRTRVLKCHAKLMFPAAIIAFRSNYIIYMGLIYKERRFEGTSFYSRNYSCGG